MTTTNDPIADMLTRIRNANTAKHDTVDVPMSKMKLSIADILVDEGYVAKYDIVGEVVQPASVQRTRVRVDAFRHAVPSVPVEVTSYE